MLLKVACLPSACKRGFILLSQLTHRHRPSLSLLGQIFMRCFSLQPAGDFVTSKGTSSCFSLPALTGQCHLSSFFPLHFLCKQLT